MNDLTHLPNIGPTLSEKLAAAGITSYDELSAVGSIEAVLRIRDQNLSTCYSMLYAVEGAIQGVRWFALPKQERLLLKQEYDHARSVSIA